MEHNKHWTEEETEIIRLHYPQHGLDYCATLLPHRRKRGIDAKAQAMGVKRKRGVVEKSGAPKEEIVALYHELREIKKVAERIGVNEEALRRWFRTNEIEKVTNIRTDRIRAELTADYMANVLTIAQIALKYGIGVSEFQKARMRWGLVNPERWIMSRSGVNSVNARRQGKSTYDLWVAKHGKEEADKRDTADREMRSKRMSGSGNTMYGKPTPQGAGNGWKGWYRGHYFRSLREAVFMIQTDLGGKAWQTGERAEFVVSYTLDGAARTYRPDFVIGDIVYELKPKRLHKSREVLAKREAAEAHFAARGMTYCLTDIEVDSLTLKMAYEKGDIKMDKRYEERFVSYLAS